MVDFAEIEAFTLGYGSASKLIHFVEEVFMVGVFIANEEWQVWTTPECHAIL